MRSEGKRGIDSHFIPLIRASSEVTETSSSPLFLVAEVEDIIKSAIWLFRSSLNTHRCWSPPIQSKGAAVLPGHLVHVAPTSTQNHLKQSGSAVESSLEIRQVELLRKKQNLAPFWGAICPAVRVYCEGKLSELEGKLSRFLRDTCSN